MPKRVVVRTASISHNLDPLRRSSHCGSHSGCLTSIIRHDPTLNATPRATQGADIGRLPLRCIAALGENLGDLGRIRQVTKMTVYVQSAPGFIQLSEVSNGASERLNSVLAPFGQHVRTSVGVFALPRNAVLELDMTVAVDLPN